MAKFEGTAKDLPPIVAIENVIPVVDCWSNEIEITFAILVYAVFWHGEFGCLYGWCILDGIWLKWKGVFVVKLT